MLLHGPALERRQAFLFRIVDIAMDLFAITAVVARAQRLRERGAASTSSAVSLADLFSRATRRQVRQRFRALWFNDDAARYEAGLAVLTGGHAWLESGVVGLRRNADSLVPAPPPGAGRGSGRRPIRAAAVPPDALELEEEQRADRETMSPDKAGGSHRGAS